MDIMTTVVTSSEQITISSCISDGTHFSTILPDIKELVIRRLCKTTLIISKADLGCLAG